MKKIFTLALLTLILLCKLSAQENHLIIFSEDLNPFDAYVNGIKQNVEPQTNVKVTGLNLETYKLKVIHADETIPTLDKNIYFDPMGVATTMKITQTKKGYKLRFFGQVPLNESPSEYTEIVYHETASEEEIEVVQEVERVDTQINTTVNTSTVRPSGSKTTTESVNMNVNIGGINMGVDVNVSETTTESVEMNQQINYEQTETYTEVEEVVYEEEVMSEGPCSAVMGSADFESAQKSISSKTFSDARMTIAKQITKGNCLSADQVRDITSLFEFESGKMEYAKFAYKYCFDKGNYYKVNDAFEFESSIEELGEHISK
ncbi:MAG: DUF4476 domain-containing protein [Flavobacteriales bacterium]